MTTKLRESQVLGKHIELLREAKGMTQSDLARKSGVKRVTLATIEKGKSENPSVWLVQAIAEALGLGVDQLLDRETVRDMARQHFDERLASSLRTRSENVNEVLGAIETGIEKRLDRATKGEVEKRTSRGRGKSIAAKAVRE